MREEPLIPNSTTKFFTTFFVCLALSLAGKQPEKNVTFTSGEKTDHCSSTQRASSSSGPSRPRCSIKSTWKSSGTNRSPVPPPLSRPCCVNGTSLLCVKVCMGHQLLGREVALEPPMKQKGRLTGGRRG